MHEYLITADQLFRLVMAALGVATICFASQMIVWLWRYRAQSYDIFMSWIGIISGQILVMVIILLINLLSFLSLNEPAIWYFTVPYRILTIAVHAPIIYAFFVWRKSMRENPPPPPV